MNRAEVLDTAKQYVLHDRNANYQDPEDNFRDIAELWTWKLKKKLKPGARIETWEVAVMSAMIKIARLEGNPEHTDSWVDIAGYAACGAECAERWRADEAPASAMYLVGPQYNLGVLGYEEEDTDNGTVDTNQVEPDPQLY